MHPPEPFSHSFAECRCGHGDRRKVEAKLGRTDIGSLDGVHIGIGTGESTAHVHCPECAKTAPAGTCCEPAEFD
jgi:hypothetical protein